MNRVRASIFIFKVNKFLKKKNSINVQNVNKLILSNVHNRNLNHPNYFCSNIYI